MIKSQQPHVVKAVGAHLAIAEIGNSWYWSYVWAMCEHVANASSMQALH